jgi:uncharacterized membrane protein YeaQ/YmgE (transglycosylase-associated protein family)
MNSGKAPISGPFAICTFRDHYIRDMGILWSLIVGGIAGWLAGQFMKGSGYGFVVNILLGLVGGFVGGWVFGLLGLDTTNTIGRIICATIGAVLVIVVARAIRK